jgi:3-phenylpropionate/trans-cinnamate dioxygenase ferredoxin subunit
VAVGNVEEEGTVGFTRVAALGEIPEGETRAYDLSGTRVAVSRVESRLFAFGDECTHQGCSLAEGALDERAATVECPCHGSVFDIETGEPVEGPAADPLPVFEARVVDGWVEVTLTPRDA